MKGLALAAAFIGLVAACSSAKKGESCADEGRIGGECEEGLLCSRSKDDDVSALICLQPCESDAVCADNESCSGERGRNLKACRPR